MIILKSDRLKAAVIAALVVLPAAARAEQQVQVEVIEEGETDDFFDPPKEKKPPKKTETPPPPTAPPPTVQVIVTGNQQSNVQTQAAETKSLENDMDEARGRIAEKKAEQTAETTPPSSEEEESAPSCDSRDFWSSWNRPAGIHVGDVLLSVIGGPSATGAFGGLSVEVLLSEHLGLYATGFADPLGEGQLKTGGWRGWDFANGAWARPHTLSTGGAQDGAFHMEELGTSFHFAPGSHWDPYLNLGASHLGYVSDRNGQQDIGGAIYLRTGAGLRWFWKAAFFGAEVGWYPVEIARYQVLTSNRGPDVVEQEAQTFDSRRVVFSFRAGIKF